MFIGQVKIRPPAFLELKRPKFFLDAAKRPGLLGLTLQLVESTLLFLKLLIDNLEILPG